MDSRFHGNDILRVLVIPVKTGIQKTPIILLPDYLFNLHYAGEELPFLFNVKNKR